MSTVCPLWEFGSLTFRPRFRGGKAFGVVVGTTLGAATQLFESLQFVAIGPNDPRTVRLRLSTVQPAPPRPIRQFPFGHMQFFRQLGQPPFALS